MVVFRQRTKILAEPPAGVTVAPSRVVLTAKPTPYSLVSDLAFLEAGDSWLFPLYRLFFLLWLEVLDPSLIHGYKFLEKYQDTPQKWQDCPLTCCATSYQAQGILRPSVLTPWSFGVCWQSSICQDHVMDLVHGLLWGD